MKIRELEKENSLQHSILKLFFTSRWAPKVRIIYFSVLAGKFKIEYKNTFYSHFRQSEFLKYSRFMKMHISNVLLTRT